MPVDITPGFRYPPDNPDGFPGLVGGVRIATENRLVTRPFWESPNDQLYWHDARGNALDRPAEQFFGEYMNSTVKNLQKAIRPFLDGTAERHREYVAEVHDEALKREVVFSHLDADHVRIAANGQRESDAKHVPLEAMVGAPIDPKEFARELIECRRAMIEYVENAYTDTWRDFSEEIEAFRPLQLGLIEDLEGLLD